MRPIILLLFMVSSTHGFSEDPPPPAEQNEEAEPDDTADRCKGKAEGLRNDMAGLEFFLQDKSDYKTFCPYEDWTQPALEIYKEEPKSYLPKSCKAEKI
jgi:hypothetical protein